MAQWARACAQRERLALLRNSAQLAHFMWVSGGAFRSWPRVFLNLWIYLQRSTAETTSVTQSLAEFYLEVLVEAHARAVVRLFIGGDVVLYREGLKEAIERRGGAQVLGTGELGAETLASVLSLRPSLLLLDMSSPQALTIARAVTVGAPTVRIVALGLEECAPSVIACAEAGIVVMSPVKAL